MWFVLGLFIVGGVWSFMSMGKKEDSTFVLKTAVVTCSYPGATPLQVEQLISEPVARELQSMRGVHKITSESYYGYSKITVELNPATRADEIPQLWDELRRKVTNISPQLPAGAGAIRVNDDFSDVYGLYYGLVADDGFSWSEIRDWAQRIKTDVVTVEGVQKVALFAEQTPVINLYVTMSALANFDITPEMIVATISQQNAIVNSGRVVAGEMEIRVLETGVYGSVEDIADQLLIASDGRQFRLGDIARIEEGYVEPPTSLMYVDGRRAVGIGVSSEPERDVVALGAEVRSHLEQLSRQMPVGMDIVTLYPEDEIARRANMSFLVNLLESVAIVIVVIMLAMGARSGSLIGSSLLFTIGGTMLCMYMTGEGINRTSLAGFIIAMGMLVDNAIVVTDNALTAASAGTPLREALVRGAEGPKWGLLGATLIAVFSFLPLYLAPSAVAEIVKPLFVVIALSLLISWVLALTQVPMFGLMMLRPPFRVAASERFASFDRVLRWMLRHRWGVVAATVALFVGAVAAMRVMPQNFFPQIDKPYFRADIILPEGYDIEATQLNLDTMARWLQSQPEVVHVSTTAGSTPVRYYLASSSVSSRPNFGNILVEVDDKRSTEAVKERFDSFVLTTCPDVWLRSSLFKLSPVPDATIEIGFVGNDIDTLLRLTHDVEQIMWRDGDAVNIRNSWGNRIPTWMPVYSQMKGQRIGVNRSQMAQDLTVATQGFPLGEFREGDLIMPILLKDENLADYNLTNLQTLPLFTPAGRVFSLGQATDDFRFDFRTGVIRRYNRERVMKAQCDPAPGVNAARLFATLRDEVRRTVELPEGYTLRIFGEEESREESNAALMKYLPLTAAAIFFILLLLFGNYRDPVAVLLLAPLLFIGVVAGLLVTGRTFNFFALLGLIGLAGMYVKNAVVLVARIGELRSGGMAPGEALAEATRSRIVPVVSASGTTVLGMLPLLFDSMFGAMAATIMGGLLAATLLTILVLPVVYALFHKIRLS